jgi:hypothetical protein
MLGQPLHEALPPSLLKAVGDSPGRACSVSLTGRDFQVLTRPLKSGGAMRGQLVLLVEQPLAEAF